MRERLPTAATSDNQTVYDREPGRYGDLALQPAERELLRRLRGRWARMDVLDLGVGTGRTAYTFAALARSYVGLDYAPSMIEAARRLVPEDESTRLVVGDARDLSAFDDASYDLVMFSYNGIDSVDHGDRLRVLAEVRRVLRPDGGFFFSAHSLGYLPFRPLRTWPRPRLGEPLRSTYHSVLGVRHALRLRRSNRDLDLEAARREGWALVQDPAHDFKLRLYYVSAEFQVRQLGEAGFTLEATFDPSGRELQPREARDEPWLHYLCRPSAAQEPA